MSRSAEKDVTTRVEREHRWFEYGRWFTGFGSSMDPHICGEDGTVCEWRERTITVTPWSDWTRPIPPAAHDYLGWRGGGCSCSCGRRFDSVQDYDAHITPPATTERSQS